MRARALILFGLSLSLSQCDVANGGGAGAARGGIGKPCTADSNCRGGLVCDKTSSTCQPGHSSDQGMPCVIGAECKQGLYCAGGKCATAGMGKEGDGCTSDANCSSGLRCALVGFSGGQCVKEGSVDVGGACKTSSDCFGGLGCIDKVCVSLPPGVPPFGKFWSGVFCSDESGPVKAYFRVPRKNNDDGDFFRLPYPNDVRVDGGKLDLSGFPTPGEDLLGFDPVQRYVDELKVTSDGWGMYHSVFFRFSGELDSKSFDKNIKVVDLTTGNEANSLYFSYSLGTARYICDNRMMVRLAQGRVWEPGHSYAVLILDGFKAKDGTPVKQAADLGALLAASAPSDAALAPHYPKYQSLRDYLQKKSIAVPSVIAATVFTVGKPLGTMEAIAKAIGQASPPTASQWTRCDTGVKSPCPDATGERACTTANPDFHELHALVELPIFQKGTAPYLSPSDGGDVALAAGSAKPERTEKVCLSLTVPKGAPPPKGWPVIVHAHGTGGHFRSHLQASVVSDFAKGVDDGKGTKIKAAVLGIDQVQHGPRRNGSKSSPNDLFFNFTNPKAARGNVLQGAADQLALLRIVPTVTFDASGPTAEAFSLSASAIAFWGHSQGATEGALAAPYGAWSGVLFSGQGASLKDALVTKTSPVDIAAAVPFVLQDFDDKGKLRHGTDHPVLNLLQHYTDASDPVSYGALAVKSPPMGFPHHHVLQVYGLGDTYTPDDVQATYALAAQLDLVKADASATMPKDIGLTPVNPPVSGNAKPGTAVLTAAVRQYGPQSGKDGHFVFYDVANARADGEKFLAGALSGIVPIVGN